MLSFAEVYEKVPRGVQAIKDRDELADEEHDPLRPRQSGSLRPPLKPFLVRLASLLHSHLIALLKLQIGRLRETPM